MVLITHPVTSLSNLSDHLLILLVVIDIPYVSPGASLTLQASSPDLAVPTDWSSITDIACLFLLLSLCVSHIDLLLLRLSSCCQSYHYLSL